MADDARGTLYIRDLAAERIAVAAALGVPGCIRHSGRFERLTRREYPKVDVEMDAQAVAVSMHIAVGWPAPLAVVAEKVRDVVTAHLDTYLGRPVIRCDVHVAAVVPGTAIPDPGRAARVTAAEVLAVTDRPSPLPITVRRRLRRTPTDADTGGAL